MPIIYRGYNTQDEREAAQNIPGLLTINLKQFAELMQWGVVMGVCAPPCSLFQYLVMYSLETVEGVVHQGKSHLAPLIERPPVDLGFSIKRHGVKGSVKALLMLEIGVVYGS